MKVSELKIGQRILLPCMKCGRKRSLKFKGMATYPTQKIQPCRECSQEERDMGHWYQASPTHQRHKLRNVEGLD